MISVCTGVRVSRPVYRDHAPLFWSQFTPVQSTTHTSQHCCSLYHRDHSHPHRDHPQDLWQCLSIPQLSSLWSWAVLILTTVFVFFTKSKKVVCFKDHLSSLPHLWEPVLQWSGWKCVDSRSRDCCCLRPEEGMFPVFPYVWTIFPWLFLGGNPSNMTSYQGELRVFISNILHQYQLHNFKVKLFLRSHNWWRNL